MQLSKEEECQMKNLSPIFKQVFRMLKHCMDDLLSGACSEEELSEAIAKVSPQENGYICPYDYLTVDECLKMLNMDRAQFYQKVVHKGGLKREFFNNHSLGYKKSDIERFIRNNKCKEEKRKRRKSGLKY